MLESGINPVADRPVGRLVRVTRLMARAIRFDKLMRAGEATDYSELARVGHATCARVTQIMNLLMLARDIQEEILFLSRVTGYGAGRDPIYLRQLQPISLAPNWPKQRAMWNEINRGPQ